MVKNFFWWFYIDMNMDSISFGAIPINKVTIKKWNKTTNKFTNYPVSFVKIDADNKSDLEAVYKTSLKWKARKEAKYIQPISTSSQWLKGNPIDVYALTLQSDKFENLQAGGILGFAEMREDEAEQGIHLLNFLQVRPNAMNVNQKYKVIYKHIGSGILTSLKKIYNRIHLHSENDENVEKFYQKNGFIDDYKGSMHYTWDRNPFKRFLLRIKKFRLEKGI